MDAEAAGGLGTACTRTEERIDAAFGIGNGAIIRFEPCLDVPEGGALCALPALLANGLLHGAESLLGQVSGYYRTLHILLLLAFMALCRIKTIEKFRGHSPGEFGKLLGLDRVPEVRCLRQKLAQLCPFGKPAYLAGIVYAMMWRDSFVPALIQQDSTLPFSL